MAGPRTFRLRRANAGDRDLVFDWRNRPEIVRLGSSQRAVSAEEHRSWFDSTVADPTRLLMLVVVDDEPVGQVRFDGDRDGASAEVSIYLLEMHTGKSLGVEALRQGCALAFEELGVDRIDAHILAGNERSLRAFRRAGFGPAPAGVSPRVGHEALSLRRPRSGD